MDPLSIPDRAGFSRRLCVHGPDQTRALGAAIARVVRPGDAVLLHGPLGAGKTCLVQGFCAELAVSEEVTSPTFTLVNRYTGRLTVDHPDFYRVEPDDDMGDIGVMEILDELDSGRTVLLAEWPRLLASLLPRRVELLALPVDGDPDARCWYARGIPELPAPWHDIFPEADPSC